MENDLPMMEQLSGQYSCPELMEASRMAFDDVWKKRNVDPFLNFSAQAGTQFRSFSIYKFLAEFQSTLTGFGSSSCGVAARALANNKSSVIYSIRITTINFRVVLLDIIYIFFFCTCESKKL